MPLAHLTDSDTQQQGVCTLHRQMAGSRLCILKSPESLAGILIVAVQGVLQLVKEQKEHNELRAKFSKMQNQNHLLQSGINLHKSKLR